MGYTRSQMKCEVKHDIRRSRPNAVFVSLAVLAAALLISLLHYFAQKTVSYADAGARLWTFLELGRGVLTGGHRLDELIGALWDTLRAVVGAAGAGLLASLVCAVPAWTLRYGYQGYCLSMVRGEKVGFLRLLCAFPQWGWVLLTRALIALFIFLWALLTCIVAGAATAAIRIFLSDRPSLSTALVVVVWLAAAVFAGIYIPLRYAMANYILLDERTDALEAISRSKSLLRGRMWHLLILRLSFIGWYGAAAAVVGAVAGITAGITWSDIAAETELLPFVTRIAGASAIAALVSKLVTIPLNMCLAPYLVGSEAKFFDWMKETDIEHGVWESDRQYKAPYLPHRDGPPPERPARRKAKKEPEEVPVPDEPEELYTPPPDPDDFTILLSDLPVEEPDEPPDDTDP